MIRNERRKWRVPDVAKNMSVYFSLIQFLNMQTKSETRSFYMQEEILYKMFNTHKSVNQKLMGNNFFYPSPDLPNKYLKFKFSSLCKLNNSLSLFMEINMNLHIFILCCPELLRDTENNQVLLVW